jgi:hypothetical protein
MRLQIKKQVEDILQTIPETRNSDITLMIELWKRFYSKLLKKGSTGELGVWLEDLHRLPREDNIKRWRAKFQNDEGKYLPTLWSVAKQRKIEEEKWRDAMRRPDTL